MDANTLLLYLLQNYNAFYSSIEDIELAACHLSDASLLLNSWNVSSVFTKSIMK